MATSFLQVANSATTTLASTITADATSLSVASGAGALFPSSGTFHITIDSEILACTSRSSDTLTVTRAQESTSAAEHLAAATVTLNVTAKALSDIHTAVNALEGVLPTSLTDGGVLLGSGSGEITAMSVLANGEMIVGDGTTDPVAESGATLRASIGVGATDSPQFAGGTLASASASEPILNITNTHAGATAGILRFNKDSASGATNDVMGTIEFFGTDASNATHEKLAYIDSYVVDATAGGEQGGLRFYVAENAADLALGLSLVGQGEDGEVDATIGAGAASVTTVAGTLTMGSTAALTNTGLVAVADQSNITGVSTLSSGAVSSGFGNIDIGSSNLTATGTVSLGATAFNDNNITNVGSVALDTITSDGTTVGFGTDGTGEDVYFYSDTSGDHMFWDSSEEKLVITGTDSQNALEVADGNVTITDNLTVSGDFTVSGTTTTVDTTNLTVTAPLIKLAHGTTASPANDLGIIFTRGNGSSTNIANRAILLD